MTVKEHLHAIIDDLDEQRASELLAFALREVARTGGSLSGVSQTSEPGVDVDRETLWRIARPVTEDDPLWTIAGLLDDDGPTDMSSDKHAYLAKIYADLHDE